MNNIIGILSMLSRYGNSPEQIANTLMRNNPQFNMLLNQIKSSGLTPQQFLNQYARQNNIDLNQVQQMAQQIGIRF